MNRYTNYQHIAGNFGVVFDTSTYPGMWYVSIITGKDDEGGNAWFPYGGWSKKENAIIAAKERFEKQSKCSGSMT